MVSKIFKSFDEAVADIKDGATIMIACFAGPGGFPYFLVKALAKHGAKDLTVISNTAGGIGLTFDFDDHKILFENRQVRKVIASFPFSVSPSKPTCAEKQIIAGELELELVPQGTLVERIRAGGAGMPAFYTPTGAGTIVAEGKEERIFGGRPCLLEHALRADYAFIRAYKADKLGNLIYRGTQRHLNPAMATAADIVIAEVDEIVAVGRLDPEAIITPGIFVKRIVRLAHEPDFPRHLNKSFWAKPKKGQRRKR
ncbi:MAG: hypothetical protein A2667_00045 [Candidatus Wildermuthbacteria bacterium RIFCSPHIGHO2_01_FULL_47_27]|uniref:3-oxoadipate CoA-transferase n=2 Tax=Candidatus Wildermuthiibacteriota TaxID=1817923 RepID=A0A1G2RNJ6_9BACT|nr:MAG: 3-oxoadipate CoA-transferase subunit A [Parcubacteria group bacterium GW2011_GWA2_47_9]OHA63484.1 MAG: hypothetical protein A2667_00045 [Candidatus Wildermuthbacteria bacterium RIFCSPHIGHO2_01_FULL_47_27]OHA67548.1 MAG: hypothetical protein A3D59_02100 [Candidatus Wildermuthbacteria bacterium RIFCSPHIGHO2_02_FULL_47_17]OHA74445.1 MAG: hypothetical protein A3A32_00015 [Candidatus Wildermuthbacteria bacterium RIFCSPLOWO2_01_FULL_48_35]OHA76027.1 MAG: hypothetical protein A3I38_03240 [Cand